MLLGVELLLLGVDVFVLGLGVDVFVLGLGVEALVLGLVVFNLGLEVEFVLGLVVLVLGLVVVFVLGLTAEFLEYLELKTEFLLTSEPLLPELYDMPLLW